MDGPQSGKLEVHGISRFSICACALGRVNPPTHATKDLKCAKGIPLNCDKGLKPRVEHGVTCTSICLVLRSFTVENHLAELLFLHNASLLLTLIIVWKQNLYGNQDTR